MQVTSYEAQNATARIRAYFDCDTSAAEMLASLRVIELFADGRDPYLEQQASRAAKRLISIEIDGNDGDVPELLDALDNIENSMSRWMN